MSLFRLSLEHDDPNGWVAFDLDGTAAHYDGWKGITHISDPIPKTIAHILAYINAGVTVKFLTARVATEDEEEKQLAINTIQAWSKQHIGHVLDATCIKDRHMIRLYDDRAVRVAENTGEVI